MNWTSDWIEAFCSPLRSWPARMVFFVVSKFLEPMNTVRKYDSMDIIWVQSFFSSFSHFSFVLPLIFFHFVPMLCGFFPNVFFISIFCYWNECHLSTESNAPSSAARQWKHIGSPIGTKRNQLLCCEWKSRLNINEIQFDCDSIICTLTHLIKIQLDNVGRDRRIIDWAVSLFDEII